MLASPMLDAKPDIDAIRAQFPGMKTADGAHWHYLDTGATAQKPVAVIDAMARAMGRDYATVHRGVYARSAAMTLAYEGARRRVADFMGARDDDIVFVRGATEAINLIAQTHETKGRVLLSVLEHHSNIVPWQLAGWQVDVCPLTADGQIDLDAAAAILTPDHKMVALAHVSNVLGSVLDVPRAADLAHRVGAQLLVDGCQAAPRVAIDMGALECDHYVWSGHKLYGPTGIGVLWSRHLDHLPPWQGGGSMIDRVRFDGTSFAPAPTRFEAGTPAIAEAIALAAAIDYVDSIGIAAISAHEQALVQAARTGLAAVGGVTVLGPPDGVGIVSFMVDGVHPHDVGTILDEGDVAIRAGHHCAQPLMEHLGLPATARASFGLYNDSDDVAALLDGIARVKRIFG